MTVRITVKSIVKSFLNVGMGPTIDLNVDNAFNRVIDSAKREYLFIPGSTIKGILRKNALSRLHTVNGATIRKLNELFGVSGAYPGKIWVRSIKISPSKIELMKLNRIRIDRKTNTAAKKALFTEEVLPPLSQISFIVEVYSNDPIDVEIILLAISELNYQKFGKGDALEVECIKPMGEVLPEFNEIAQKYNLQICRDGD